MSTRWVICGVVVLGLVALAAPAAAGDDPNEPPMVDAGLDQTVERTTRVYLDGDGSRDPDGEIAAVRWEITAPDGSTTTPDCPTCTATGFIPQQNGTYTVTLRATDGDGAAASDTLYVEVGPQHAPRVSLDGPTRLNTSQRGTVTAQVRAGDRELSYVVWRVDGERQDLVEVTGDHASVDRSVQFPAAGTHTVSAVGVDWTGQRRTGEVSIPVSIASAAVGAAGGGPPSTSGAAGTCPPGAPCTADSVMGWLQDGEYRVQLANRDGGGITAAEVAGDGLQPGESETLYTASEFQRMDTDGNGMLETSEVPKSARKEITRAYAKKQGHMADEETNYGTKTIAELDKDLSTGTKTEPNTPSDYGTTVQAMKNMKTIDDVSRIGASDTGGTTPNPGTASGGSSGSNNDSLGGSVVNLRGSASGARKALAGVNLGL